MIKNKAKYWFYILVFLAVGLISLLKMGVITNSIFSEEKYHSIDASQQESCLGCHQNTKGYSEYHNPEIIGCASCHLGNTTTFNKTESHKGMVLIPGNLVDAKLTCGKCHIDELHKIENSLMTTNSGLVAVDKYIFGEANSPNQQYHIQLIKNSGSDKHIRDLCANCHLGAEKKEFGAITQLSRGGGCNACHLNYTSEAKNDLENYLTSNKKRIPKFHPSTDIFVTNEHCFGCHSRSSRISTDYEGFQETLLDESEINGKAGYKVIEDKRVYEFVESDVHHKKGLLCIDCHTSHEVMGDGKKYTHEEQAVKIQCSDCHFKNAPLTMPYDSLDTESLKVYLHRDYTHADKSMIAVRKSGHPLVNTFIDSVGNAFLIGKGDGKIHTLNKQSAICSRDNAHQSMSCATCHSSWTSKCIGCHNQFDENEPRAFDLLDKKYGKGQWKEFVSEFGHSKPALGVRENSEGKHIEPAVPGMILTIDKGSYSGKQIGEDVSFHRLYAPNSPHTTISNARDCKSCHADSYALGYGSGNLTFNLKQRKWTFEPEYAKNENDNLPEDAWIPFLGSTPKGVINSTRTDFRPFTVKEQQKLLTIGACLQCHTDDSDAMQESLNIGLDSILKQLDKSCILPTWN